MATKSKLNILERICVELLWLFCRTIAILPRWIKYYVLEEIIYVTLYKIGRYRVKVVTTNLRNSFPEKSFDEIRTIRRKFYRTLSEMFINTISLAEIGPKRIMEHAIIQKDAIQQLVKETAGRNWIAMTAHFGCWEYFAFWSYYAKQQITVGVYHPLDNKIFEELFKRIRSYPDFQTVAMKNTARFYVEHVNGINGKAVALGLIADQNPPRLPNSHWFRFLNQDTLFFDGGEKLAMKFHVPVYFLNQHRLKRGVYEMSYECIYDGKEQVAEYEITERYVRKLEQAIVKTPELWLWSHRRWKHKRES